MTIYKTNELTGDLLNRAVAKVLNNKIDIGWSEPNRIFEHFGDLYVSGQGKFAPTERWSQCGQLIEKFKINVAWFERSKIWSCSLPNQINGQIANHEDLKTAICRCVVKSVLGNEVEL